MSNVPKISVQELKAELESNNPPSLLDVRRSDELNISVLPGVVHIVLAELPDRYAELDKNADWVVVCRSGVRSAQAITFLQSIGFTQLRNLEGGMNEWATSIDPSLPVY